jgi:hypothetical protein
MKRLLLLALVLLLPTLAVAETRYRPYANQTVITFALRDAANVNDFFPSATFASGDCLIIKDRGAAANCTNSITDETNGLYSLVLTSTEMAAINVDVIVADATASETWAAKVIHIETSGVPAAIVNSRN